MRVYVNPLVNKNKNALVVKSTTEIPVTV